MVKSRLECKLKAVGLFKLKWLVLKALGGDPKSRTEYGGAFITAGNRASFSNVVLIDHESKDGSIN